MSENLKASEGIFKSIYKWLVVGETILSHPFLLIIRLYWGFLLAVAGFGKLANISGTAEFFETLNIPSPLLMTYLVGIFELLGGLSLFFGLFTRLLMIPVIVILIVAFLTAHKEAVSVILTNPSLFTTQSPFLYLFTALVVFCFGPGLFSFDYWMEKRAYGKAL